eukprot:TRINITY_DN6067_c0_g2_i1.p1 TRINITY_DN6067_c0_g2~~TRINITY_DN6067_c0_g2_i1.p1  ORF type:complete len:240 (-),score=52.82 TRINITY_DN6067_c0_g2_i1:81-800(-)
MAPVHLLLVVLCLLVPVAYSAQGIDVSLVDCDNGISASQWECMRNNGNTFAIIETWMGGYQFATRIAECVSNAWAAKFEHVDVYVFICPNCQGNNPIAGAITEIVHNLKTQGVNYGMLWFDIEQCNGCWNDAASNFAFITTAIKAAQNLGVKVGVYSSNYEWAQTVGGATGLSNLPLWYADWDNVQSFTDWPGTAFGGWNAPAIKQYYDHGNGNCGIDTDLNWYPDGLFNVSSPILTQE